MRLLTVGLGSLPGEARATGVDFRTRGRRTDEAIEVLRLLWSGSADGVSYSGEFFAFEDLVSFPKPLADLPIHIGGSSRAAAQGVTRLVVSTSSADPAEQRDQLSAFAERHGL
ncbi:luciferase-like monooxygenase [Kribbella antiqua]|uniref:Luciferase-like monooxygenase n=2 Tax=Kribbella antiqua TaxID=2512217 RepID=A0A4R2ITW5_9ACTN|nr:luciferase-like monooxygenase [Kribbella antiqua]